MAKANAWCGDSAISTSGCCAIWRAPSTNRMANQISMIGPNSWPMPPVPKCCMANRPISTTMAIGRITGWKAGVATFRPSTALSTEMAGVSRQSP